MDHRQKTPWSTVIQHMFSLAFGDRPFYVVASYHIGDPPTWGCACSCNSFPTQKFCHYSRAHIIINFSRLMWFLTNCSAFPELQEEEGVMFRDAGLEFRENDRVKIRSKPILLHEPLDITGRISYWNQPPCLGHVLHCLISLLPSGLFQSQYLNTSWAMVTSRPTDCS